MRTAREALVLLAACALLYLPGAGAIPFYTRGEAREGLVVREMVRTGAWLVPMRPGGEPTRKPPLYYWLAAPALRALPTRPELALRLPSIALATAGVLTTWATGRAVFGAAAGLPAALVLATAFEWARAATSARVDMTLAAPLVAVIAGWALALAGRRRAGPLLALVGATLGTLAKGPVALVLPALAAAGLVAVRADVRPLRVVIVLAIAATLAGAWYAVAFRREGTAFLAIVARENVLRFVDTTEGQTGHAHSPAYLVPLGLVGLLPWTPVLALAAVPLAGRPRQAVAVFCASWVVTGIVFFTLAAGKRSVYLLPLFPAIAFLAGAGATAAPAGRLARAARAGGRLYAPAAALVAAATVALAAGVDVSAPLRRWLAPADAAGAAVVAAAVRGEAPWFVALAIATVAVAAFIDRAARRSAWRPLVLGVAAMFAAWTAAFDGLVHPTIARARSLAPFLATVARTVPPGAPLYARFPADPGLRFYAPATLRPLPPDGAFRGGYVLLWEDEWHRMRDASGAELPVVALSDVGQPRRGRLALVAAPDPHGGVRRGTRSR